MPFYYVANNIRREISCRKDKSVKIHKNQKVTPSLERANERILGRRPTHVCTLLLSTTINHTHHHYFDNGT